MKIGSCGICCETCGLFTRKICKGCEKTQEHVMFLKTIDANCPVLECAVKNNINIFPRDCDKFPCDNFDKWPLSREWLDMFKARIKGR